MQLLLGDTPINADFASKENHELSIIGYCGPCASPAEDHLLSPDKKPNLPYSMSDIGPSIAAKYMMQGSSALQPLPGASHAIGTARRARTSTITHGKKKKNRVRQRLWHVMFVYKMTYYKLLCCFRAGIRTWPLPVRAWGESSPTCGRDYSRRPPYPQGISSIWQNDWR